VDWLFSDNLFAGLALYAVLAVLAVWVALVLWCWQDMGGRSRNTGLRLLAALLIVLLNLPGLFIYLLLRPRETLAEAWERSLEEEVLLQEIEERPVCPSCKARAQANWQICAACHTRLRNPCTRCGGLLEPGWERCPLCAARQAGAEDGESLLTPRRRFRSTAATAPARERDGQPV